MNIKDIEEMEDQGDVKGLSLVLDHPNAELRSAAADALCKVGDEQAVASLIETLSNDDAWVVRRYAAEALGNIGSQEGVESLELALNNDPYRALQEAFMQHQHIGALKIGTMPAGEGLPYLS